MEHSSYLYREKEHKHWRFCSIFIRRHKYVYGTHWPATSVLLSSSMSIIFRTNNIFSIILYSCTFTYGGLFYQTSWWNTSPSPKQCKWDHIVRVQTVWFCLLPAYSQIKHIRVTPLINVSIIENFKIPTACSAMLQTSKTAFLTSEKNLASQSSV